MVMTEPSIYHERQSLLRCGIHAINNLLQDAVVDQAAMDTACEALVAAGPPPEGPASALTAWLWHPHRAPLGLGNYDVNVLMLVLQQRGLEMRWLDKRQPAAIETLNFDDITGVLCNVVTSGGLLRRVWESRHWFAVRKLRGLCVNLDSKLREPMAFAGDDDCRRFLKELLATGECEVFAVTRAPPPTTSTNGT